MSIFAHYKYLRHLLEGPQGSTSHSAGSPLIGIGDGALS